MSDSRQPITGVLPVFQTPYLADESIDRDTLEHEWTWLFEQGADGLVFAMVSEILRLSSEERDRVAEQVCTFARRHERSAIISIGAESAHTAERHARHAEAVGAHALMAIPPVSVGVDLEELGSYYRRILNAVQIPVVVQDASGYVGRPMPIEFQAGLLREFGADRVGFKPEAAPIGPRLSALRDATDGQARIFEGTGGIALVDSHRRGVTGTMPGADLVRALVPLWRALETGNDEAARAIHAPLSALISLQTSLDAFLAVEKHLLVRQGIFTSEHVRGPRGFSLDPETRDEVDRLFDRLMAAVVQTSTARPSG